MFKKNPKKTNIFFKNIILLDMDWHFKIILYLSSLLGKFVYLQQELHPRGRKITKYNFRFLDCLASTNRDLITLYNIGKSVEGRNIKVVRVSTGGAGKKAIFIGTFLKFPVSQLPVVQFELVRTFF